MSIIFIIGSTGTKKSKLSIELTKHFSCGIISADSMQIFKDFNIGSAKVSINEQKDIHHSLIDIVDPDCIDFTVKDYLKISLSAISRLHDEKKIPLVVGGTLYYIEALLWKTFLSQGVNIEEKCEHTLIDLNSDNLYHHLVEVDPLMAEKLHPNDLRKIKRSLEVYNETGVPHSTIIRTSGGKSGVPRFPCLILWLYCDSASLEKRLNDRVDVMMSSGLLNEVTRLYELTKNLPLHVGLNQAIGFKEFFPYLQAPIEEKTDSLLCECVEKLKKNTRCYALKQQKWFKNRIASSTNLQLVSLDTSILDDWDDKVLQPAIIAISSFLTSKHSREIVVVNNESEIDNWRKYYCEICNRTLNGKNEWSIHQTSRSHKKRKRKHQS